MRAGRVLVAVSVSAGVLAGAANPAAAQLPAKQRFTWRQAAALADYPVYRPTRALGLAARVTTQQACPTVGKVEVVADFGKRSGQGPQLRMLEARPSVCGDVGQMTRYHKVRIHHRTVWVLAACEVRGSQCRVIKGSDPAWYVSQRRRSGGRRVEVGLYGSGLSFRAFVRVARSLTRVKRATDVPLAEFLSSDGAVWCRIGRYDPTDRFCVSHGGADEYGATVLLDGTVHLCGAGQADPYAECTQTWNPYALRLKDGLSSDFGGYLCTEQTGAMTCTVKDGPAKGRGFRVGPDGSQVISVP